LVGCVLYGEREGGAGWVCVSRGRPIQKSEGGEQMRTVHGEAAKGEAKGKSRLMRWQHTGRERRAAAPGGALGAAGPFGREGLTTRWAATVRRQWRRGALLWVSNGGRVRRGGGTPRVGGSEGVLAITGRGRCAWCVPEGRRAAVPAFRIVGQRESGQEPWDGKRQREGAAA
jgi:hypothetical protein